MIFAEDYETARLITTVVGEQPNFTGFDKYQEEKCRVRKTLNILTSVNSSTVTII